MKRLRASSWFASAWRHALFGAVALLLLVQVVGGSARLGAQVCVCSSGTVVLAHQADPCCADTMGDDAAEHTVVVSPSTPCDGCHLVPLPDAPTLAWASAPLLVATPMVVSPYPPLAETRVSTPPLVMRWMGERAPPHLRMVRTVVIRG